MKFYVASGVSNAEKVNLAAAALNAAGHERTYDWTGHGDVSKAEPEFKRHVASSESRGVLDAELVVLLLPGRFGTHAELGMALASAENKRILLWSESPSPFDGTEGFCVFYHHPAVERVVCPFDELLEQLKAL
ncbi:MAG: hypothetical protein CVV04_02455 [Firmicutes bacterium HGW-Firmicutes-9]|jgi:hypothetical protein|nr:MAG: hypothetical protein CVV04_02455 [Firmicutes bacterium HGW-Firmicutes-9]